MSASPARLLTIDLSTREVGELTLKESDRRELIGGASLAARVLYPHLLSELDPLGPDNPLAFMPGPLTGAFGPAQGRYVVCAKSPATGLWGESNCGGFFGPEIRLAGWEGIVITGRAVTPVYLWLDGGRVEIREARHLWGQADTYQTQMRIKAEVNCPRARVACIGVAGERRSPLALLLTDHGRVAGRTGMGAVMGAKNLKAIAVHGRGRVPLARDAEFKRLRTRTNTELRADTISGMLRDGGSASGAEYLDLLGMMPKRYFSQGTFDGVGLVSGAAVHDTILTGVSTCHGCVIACGRVVTIHEGPYAAQAGKGPEYETIVGFGPNLLVDDLGAITHLGRLCDAYGFDTIGMSNTIGLVYLLVSEGIIPPSELGALLPRWGDPSAAEALVHMAASGNGLGAWVAKGARALARHFGVEERAVQVNGLEAAYHDPRGASGMALVYATSPRGACHNQSDFYIVEVGQTVDEIGVTMSERQAVDGKAAKVARHQDWRTACNAMVQCIFANVPPPVSLEFLNAATDFDYSLEEFMACGERGWNLKRAINHRLGLTRANDRLPKAFLEPYPDGPTQGFVPDFDVMLSDYYAVRGWDEATGRPARTTLERLGMCSVADDLWGSAN